MQAHVIVYNAPAGELLHLSDVNQSNLHCET